MKMSKIQQAESIIDSAFKPYAAESAARKFLVRATGRAYTMNELAIEQSLVQECRNFSDYGYINCSHNQAIANLEWQNGCFYD